MGSEIQPRSVESRHHMPVEDMLHDCLIDVPDGIPASLGRDARRDGLDGEFGSWVDISALVIGCATVAVPRAEPSPWGVAIAVGAVVSACMRSACMRSACMRSACMRTACTRTACTRTARTSATGANSPCGSDDRRESSRARRCPRASASAVATGSHQKSRANA